MPTSNPRATYQRVHARKRRAERTAETLRTTGIVRIVSDHGQLHAVRAGMLPGYAYRITAAPPPAVPGTLILTPEPAAARRKGQAESTTNESETS